MDREKKAQAIAAAIAAATDRPGVGLASPSKHVNANGGSNWDAITLMGSPGSMDQVKFKNGGGSSGQLSPRSKTTSPTISPGYLSMEELSPLKTRKGSSPRRMDAWLEEESPRHTEYHPTRQRDGRGYEASRFHESGRHQDNRNYEGRREIWEQERPPSGQKHPARKLRLEQPYKSPGSPRRRGTFGHMLDRLSIFSRGSRNRQELEGDTYYHPPQELDGVGVPGRF